MAKENETEDSRLYSERMESKMDKLRMKWAGSDMEIVVEKIEMLESWKNDKEDKSGVKESLIDWILENEVSTLVEERHQAWDNW